MRHFGRILGAFVVAYAVMVVLITLVQESWLGGVSYAHSSLGVLLVAGVLTFFVAAFAGWLGTWLCGRAGLLVALLMSGLVVVETTALIVTGRVAGPLWFDLAAAGSLITGILIGGELFRRSRFRRQSPAT